MYVALAGSLLLHGTGVHGRGIEYRHGISLVHDLKYGADFEHFDYFDPGAPKGGVIRLPTKLDITNFTWYFDTVVNPAEGLERTYDSLLIRSSDELSSFYGLLADGVAVSEDRRLLYLRLNPDARWHDGTPLTVDDVKYTLDEAVDTLDGHIYLPWLRATEIAGERELVLRHSNAFTDANIAVVTSFPILPRLHWEGRDPTKVHPAPTVSSGPFRVGAYNRSRVRYDRVPDYWGADLPVNRGRHNFDQIHYEVYRDDIVVREAFRKGLLDVHVEADTHHWLFSFDDAQLQHVVRGTFSASRIGPAFGIVFNTGRELFEDIRVREALALAMDFEWQNRVIQHGTQTRALSVFSNSIFASSGKPKPDEITLLAPFREQLPERVFTSAFELPVSTGVGRNDVAFERARQLLAEAGWTVRGGRMVNGEGEPFAFEFITFQPPFKRTLLPYANALKRLGIEARIRLVDGAQLARRRRAREFDALMTPRYFQSLPTVYLRTFFHSTAAGPGMMTANVTELVSPVVDHLIERAEDAESLDELVTVMRSLDRVVLWQFHSIPLGNVEDTRFLYWDRFGRPEAEAEARYQWPFVDGWWYDAQKAARTDRSRGGAGGG